ncbi:MAG: hypothetical protein UH241_03710 [Acutalibacteraceae bacterium]|nr:hypothetical protein [Acutalibacteraceae bacterium]
MVKECRYCMHFILDRTYNAGGYCNYHRRPMSPYDYCGYFK